MADLFSSFLLQLPSGSGQVEKVGLGELLQNIKEKSQDGWNFLVFGIGFPYVNSSSSSNTMSPSDYRKKVLSKFPILPTSLVDIPYEVLERMSKPLRKFTGKQAELIVDIPTQFALPAKKNKDSLEIPVLVFYWDTQDNTELELTIRGSSFPFGGYFLFILEGKKRVQRIKINVDNAFTPRIWFLDKTRKQ